MQGMGEGRNAGSPKMRSGMAVDLMNLISEDRGADCDGWCSFLSVPHDSPRGSSLTSLIGGIIITGMASSSTAVVLYRVEAEPDAIEKHVHYLIIIT